MKEQKRLRIKRTARPIKPILPPTDDYYEDVVLVGGPFDGHTVKISQQQAIVKYESANGLAQYNRTSVEDASGAAAVFYKFWLLSDVAAINKLIDNYS